METLRKIPETARHLLLVTLFGLPLITPLLRWTAVPCTHDGHLHYHRIAALRHAWENGLFFSRWLPDLAFGYGYPFFVYREPAPLYAGLLPHLLGLPLPAASNLFYIVTILAAGWFMFLWVRDIFGSRAGFVAAVAYMAAPYVLIDALVRGNAPESLALPLMPLLLWLGRRWLLTGSGKAFLAGTLALAFFALSHNISLFIFTPTLLVYLLALGWLHRLRWTAVFVRIALFLGLGLGITIAYTGGALLELDQVTLQQSTTTRNNDFRFNFASPAEILAPVAPEDPNLLNPPLPFRLGWTVTALAGLAVLGAAGLLLTKRLEIGDWRLEENSQSPISYHQSLPEQVGHVWLLLAATAVFLFMALPASRFLWENIPLIDFIQFPWRFVGRAALPLAALAGVPFSNLFTPHVSRTVLRLSGAIALLLLVVETIPNLYPNVCEEAPFPTILTVHDYEQTTGLVGVDPEGSYFPHSVHQRPRSSPLLADYQAGRTPQRFDTGVLPENAAITRIEYENLGVTVELTSPAPFTARYLSFDFPGWTAVIDGEPVPITPSNPEGLITFPVPAGNHTITVSWQSTPTRTAFLGLSLMAMAGTAVVALILFVDPAAVSRGSLDVSRKSSKVTTHEQRFTTYDLRLTTYALLAIILLGLKVLVIDRVDTPLRRSASPNVAQTTALQAAELRLDGYSLSQTAVAGGSAFDIDMAWTAVESPRANYQSNVWLAGPEGLVWSDKNTERPRLYEDAPPTLFWQPGQWGWDSREVAVLAGTPPGRYDIVLTLFDLATLQPVTLLGENGNALGPTAVLGRIEVVFPDEPPVVQPQFPRQAVVPGLGLTLRGINQDRAEARPGDPLLLTLFWERAAESIDDTITIALQDEAGQTVQEWQRPLTYTSLGIAEFPSDQIVRGQYLFALSADLPGGAYSIVLNEEVMLGTLTINVPDRIFTPPGVDTAVSIPFFLEETPQTRLHGYTLAQLDAGQMSVTLVWQAEALFAERYRVFVHLVDEAGAIVAQSDGEPANWTRPTTGWLPGEFIIDPHLLTLPAELPDGPLSLRVGLYEPETNQRLYTETAEYVTIPLPDDDVD